LFLEWRVGQFCPCFTIVFLALLHCTNVFYCFTLCNSNPVFVRNRKYRVLINQKNPFGLHEWLHIQVACDVISFTVMIRLHNSHCLNTTVGKKTDSHCFCMVKSNRLFVNFVAVSQTDEHRPRVDFTWLWKNRQTSKDIKYQTHYY